MIDKFVGSEAACPKFVVCHQICPCLEARIAWDIYMAAIINTVTNFRLDCSSRM